MAKLLVDFLQYDTLEKSNVSNLINYNNYDEQTQIYKSFRLHNIDPIDESNIVDINTCFQYKYIWDPFTGDILIDKNGNKINDPNGPLCFCPCNIVKTIYYKRLDNIWMRTNAENDDFYYGDNVGIGDEFEIIGRGIYKERHLFRLPIVDCYLPKNYNKMVVSMGPILDNCDILEIDKLINNYWINDDIEVNDIYKKIKSLHNLRKLYDVIINRDPISAFSQEYIESIGLNYSVAINKTNPNIYLHHCAVDILNQMESY